MKAASVMEKVSEFEQGLDDILYRVIMGSTTNEADLRSSIVAFAEDNGVVYSTAIKNLQERIALHHQHGEYTDEMLAGVPLALKSALGLKVELGK